MRNPRLADVGKSPSNWHWSTREGAWTPLSRRRPNRLVDISLAAITLMARFPMRTAFTIEFFGSYGRVFFSYLHRLFTLDRSCHEKLRPGDSPSFCSNASLTSTYSR